MAIISVTDVTNWLKASKYQVEGLDEELADVEGTYVLGRLAARYDTTGWVTEAVTPKLVQMVIGMLVAADEYERAVAQDDPDDNYGTRLRQRAELLLTGLLDGSVSVVEVPEEAVSEEDLSVSFYPRDLQDEDILQARRFAIGQVF